jgi:hypothetical protein
VDFTLLGSSLKKCSSVAKQLLTTKERSKRENAGTRKYSGVHLWPLQEEKEKRKREEEAVAAKAPTPMNTPRNTELKKAKTTSSNIFQSRDRKSQVDLKRVWSNVVKPKLEVLVIEELAHRITPQGMYLALIKCLLRI